MNNVKILDHPYIQHKLSILKDKNTDMKLFREIVNEISLLMAYEITREFKLEEREIETPIKKTTSKFLADKSITIVPILRAGLGMVDAMLDIMPTAKVGHVGLYREEKTLEPKKYYFKLPEDVAEMEVLIVDPMLATGGSAEAAITFIKETGVKKITLACILTCPEGIERVHNAHPEVVIYAAGKDEKLSDKGYIVPGLGDAGDRLFGTK